MNNAVIYTRVSTKEQARNLSLNTQLQSCRQYCEREAFTVVAEFQDAGESAKTTDRPGFQGLLEYCRTHRRGVQFVIFYNVTRFSRNVIDWAIVQVTLRNLGVSIRSVNEPIADNSTGQLVGNLLAAVGQFENNEKARRTRAGMEAALELGRWTFQPPLGYQGSPVTRGILEHDPRRAPLIRKAFELVSADCQSLKHTLRRVTALGLTNLKGRPLSEQSFANLLRNPLYAGWIKVKKWELTVRADFPGIVTDSLFRAVQQILSGADPVAALHVRNHPDFPLRRFVRCGHCETPLTGSWSTGRTKQYGYYSCRRCRKVKQPKGQLESRFAEMLALLEQPPETLRLFRAIVLDVFARREKAAAALRSRLERVVKQKSQRLDRVDDAYLHERSIDRRTYNRQRDQLREELAVAELELNASTSNDLDVDAILGFAEHVLANASRIWMDVEPAKKLELQGALFPEGMNFDGRRFGIASISMGFNRLRLPQSPKSNVASPRGTDRGGNTVLPHVSSRLNCQIPGQLESAFVGLTCVASPAILRLPCLISSNS